MVARIWGGFWVLDRSQAMLDAGRFFRELNESVQELCTVKMHGHAKADAVDASLNNLDA